MGRASSQALYMPLCGSTRVENWLRCLPPVLQERGADDLPSARAAGSEVSLHRVSLADEPDQVFLLSRWVLLFC